MNKTNNIAIHWLTPTRYKIFQFVIWAKLLFNLGEFTFQFRPIWFAISPKLVITKINTNRLY